METENAIEEESILGAIMMTPLASLPQSTRSIVPEFFTGRDNALVWTAIEGLIAVGANPDEVSVMFALQKAGRPHVGSHAMALPALVSTTANLAHWIQLFVDAGRARVAQRKLQSAVSRLVQNKSLGSAREAISEISNELNDATKSSGLVLVRDILPTVIASIEARQKNPDVFRLCSTGLILLDRMAELRAGQLTVIAARPGMGKSALACNIAQHVAKKHTVAIFSLEMTAESLIERIMKTASFSGFEERMHIDDRPALSPAAIEAEVARLKPTLVIVDYLQLVKTGNEERQDLRVSTITKSLRAIAKRHGCHVIALAQLNRAVESRENKIPMLSDIRDSGAVEEDADNVWFIHREGYYNSSAGDVASIVIAKNRFGNVGPIAVKWDGQRQAFKNM